MKWDEFAFVNQQLAAMLKDGIPLEGALKQLCATMARGGLRVLCLEKNQFTGGMASTTELIRGYRFELAGWAYDRDVDYTSTQPCVHTRVNGAAPVMPAPTMSEELNQPRCWSGPSKYTTLPVPARAAAHAGTSSGCWTWMARCVEPESNHTSSTSVSRRNGPLPPHFGHA